MPEPVIRVENLGKRYVIGHQRQEKYVTLRDNLTNKFKDISTSFRKHKNAEKSDFEEFWALQNISFEVTRGERIGIIGRNGAGKSTLLKILSRITEPTTGRVQIQGRVASLLEVGTGFHPELTGRENIFLNGAILGMSKYEINSKFDEIVSFAEVEKFLDTPVKRYSSGMRVRLAFAVAAHLDPEILVVDEVLAVGDLAFQKKCLGKMKDVSSNEGRTVLFVSHNIATITKLCDKAIFLENGCIKKFDSASLVAAEYQKQALKLNRTIDEQGIIAFSEKNQIGIAHLDVYILPTEVYGSHHLKIRFDVFSHKFYSDIGVGIALSTLGGVCVSSIAPSITNYLIDVIDSKKTCIFECKNVEKFIAGGTYVLSIWLSKPKVEYLVKADNILTIEIPASDIFNTGNYFLLGKNGIVPMPVTYESYNSH